MKRGIPRSVVIPVAGALLFVALGCALTRPSSDPWTTYYVGSPDDVWTAIHMALVELDYDVETENRSEGVIRAVREAGDGRPSTVLSIDQVMRGNEVKVYVRVAAAPDEPAMTFERQETAAEDFLALVNGVLYK